MTTIDFTTMKKAELEDFIQSYEAAGAGPAENEDLSTNKKKAAWLRSAADKLGIPFTLGQEEIDNDTRFKDSNPGDIVFLDEDAPLPGHGEAAAPTEGEGEETASEATGSTETNEATEDGAEDTSVGEETAASTQQSETTAAEGDTPEEKPEATVQQSVPTGEKAVTKLYRGHDVITREETVLVNGKTHTQITTAAGISTKLSDEDYQRDVTISNIHG